MAETNPIVSALRNNQTPPIIINQDSSVFSTSVILNKINYPLWSQIMEMRIGSSNKAGYLTGEVKKPPPEDPSYAIWVIENYKVKSWLIDSMDPLLMQRFILLSTAKEIWKAIAKTFYDELDETCLFELNRKSFSTTQNGGPLSIYYNELVAIFQEIDHKITSQEETVEGMVQLHSQWLGFESIFFLSGLDPEFDHVYREILRKDPKLNLESTYTYVQREYQQRQTMGVPFGKLQIPTSAEESPTSEELHMITLLTKESTQNVLDTNISTQDALADPKWTKAAIEIAQNPVQHDRTKHVEVDQHFIKEKLDQKIIQFSFVKSEDQLADKLTKAMSLKIFHDMIDKLGMIDIHAPT
ncbi:uncharacterized protein LOC110624199 [Manihot esculenta]|uniref:uncharacterized protein LOC110624199 n=1 Tax=Manihot esculenta TaxID=3983 RepID=UPI000B5D5C58|nr:uncharacterized protein LOC110624199 [Manihot esculenta]